MADTVSRLAIQVGMETQALQTGANRVSSIMGELASRFRLSVDPIDLTANAIAAVGNASKAAAAYVTNLATSTEQIEMRVRGIADSFAEFRDLRDLTFDFGAGQFDDSAIAETVRRLKIEGFEIAGISDSLKVFGDIAKGSGNSLEFVADAILKMRNDGEVTFKDLRLLQQANIPIIQELQKQYGLTQAQIKQMADAGEIDFDKVGQALQRLTDEGGKFGGAVAQSAATAEGRLKSLQDQLEDLLRPGAGFALEGVVAQIDELLSAYGGIESGVAGYAKALTAATDVLRSHRMEQVEAANSTGKFAEELARTAGEAKKLEQQEAFRKAGEQLKNSLLTPQEEFNKKLGEANELRNAGVITEETYSRAIEKAREALDKQMQSVQKQRTELEKINQLAGAPQGLVRGTSGAASAVANNSAAMLQVQKQQLKALGDIVQLFRDTPPIGKAKLN
jgi:tape measure domain-containing protein